MPNDNPYEVAGTPGKWYVRHVDTGKAIAWANNFEEAVRLCDLENAATKRNAAMMETAKGDNA